MLAELTSVPGSAWPVEDLAAHLRLSRGFSDDGEMNPRLETCLRAAAAAIEARVAKAIFRRRFVQNVPQWSGSDRHVFPIAPVVSIEAVRVIARDGTETTVAPVAYALHTDAHRPALVSATGALPTIGTGAVAEIEFLAGYGATWSEIPADLRQAVLILAGEVFGQDVEADKGLSMSVLALVEPYRCLRLSGAGA